MIKKEIKRKWLVDLNKIDNLNIYQYHNVKIGYLSQQYDSLSVFLKSIDNEYFLILKDSGKKIRNVITYNISKEEFDISIQLSGNKIINKKIYYIPSSTDKEKIIMVNIFDDYEFIIAEYESNNEVEVDIFNEEKWFTKDITNNDEFYSSNIVYSL